MAELTDDSLFPSLAHPRCTQSPPVADDLLDPLQVILRRLIARHDSAQLTSFARAALAEIKRIQTAHRLATISEVVAHRFHLSPHHLRARTRDQRTAFCRQVAMHLCAGLLAPPSPSSARTLAGIIRLDLRLQPHRAPPAA
jgi:hypothetical protein